MKITVTAPTREEMIKYLASVADDLREGYDGGCGALPPPPHEEEPPRFQWVTER
jgi:hypothetical protein